VTFFLSFGFTGGASPPIGLDAVNAVGAVSVVDPLPQALVITAIILGIAVTAINLTMTLSIAESERTINWDELEK